jgi:tRNA uridine 5-carbamoylmethylation protein Kti12
MDDLRLRYEAPNESNRWDFPLFKVTVEPSLADAVSKLSLGQHNETPAIASAEPTVEPPTPTVAPTVSSFKSSWKPKKKAIETGGTNDDATVFTTLTTASNATTQTQKAISFSGTMVVQEDTTITGFLSPSEVLPKIADYFAGASVPTPNSSTIATQRANADLLYELDRTSQQVIQAIVAHQSDGVAEGTPVRFVEFDRALTLNRHASLAELQRYRRQYVKINGQHPPTSSKAIGTSFIDFLALHI